MDPWILRAVILLLGAILLLVIYLRGRPSASQGQRRLVKKAERVEPSVGAMPTAPTAELEPGLRAELDRLQQQLVSDADLSDPDAAALAARRDVADASAALRSQVGLRTQAQIDRIVTLFVMAEAGRSFNGADILVAAEKTSLVFGAQAVFHRLLDGRAELGPIFSMANRLHPGGFDMETLRSLETPGLTLFMALPGPLSALEAWDAMLPTAQRIAELLEGEVLDEDRNAVNRQRIQFMRDELRQYDREQAKQIIKKAW